MSAFAIAVFGVICFLAGYALAGIILGAYNVK
jgi:hypothetical protein